jgi:hypothetical protein
MTGAPLPFLMLAALTGGAALFVTWQTKERERKEIEVAKVRAKSEVPVQEEPISQAMKIDMVRLELGYGLLSLINNEITPYPFRIVRLGRKQNNDPHCSADGFFDFTFPGRCAGCQVFDIHPDVEAALTQSLDEPPLFDGVFAAVADKKIRG